ncbi:hypothetical protein [Myxococcus vastator]|uniref:hypothetical protein n=1 Tax=Myxococcus vastator TaxID=2709664 RepID=UPI0013D22925|nr:hypothetical protein [Myxococcus vastator]
MPTNYQSVTIRLLEAEDTALEKAVKALSTKRSKLGIAQLICTAGMEEAADLGFRPSTWPSSAQGVKVEWESPPRGREGTVPRRTITVPPLYYPVLTAAADAASVSLPLFLVGASLRWIARRKRAEPSNKALQQVHLPHHYSES